MKRVVVENRTICNYEIIDTGVDPLTKLKYLLDNQKYDILVATGYGRYLAQVHLKCPIITEIKAYALGAHYFFPNCRTVLDIGGQDSKVIRVNNGKVEDFEMNDRCAAGTGKFLEVMATTLGYTIDDFGKTAFDLEDAVSISSMCTVFAESEVVSLIAGGKDHRSIALGLHQSILNRILALVGMTGYEDEIVFAGGVAKNKCLIALLEKRLAANILIPEEPQIVGAVGAALTAIEDEEEVKV
jgi:predicted CoA-substrate-specific enzyme activase